MSSVLLVHPDRRVARQIVEAMRADGLTVVSVPDGERAIDRFIQEPFDLLVIEMVLPGRDGGNTAESIRWAPAGDRARVALIATRGTGGEELSEAEQRIRANAVYIGPPEPDAIVEVAKRALAGNAPQPQQGHALVDIATARAKALRSDIELADETEPRTVDDAVDDHTGRTDDDDRAGDDGRAGDDDRTGDDGRGDDGRGDDTHTDDGTHAVTFRRGDDPGAEREGAFVEKWADVAGSEVTVHRGDLASTSFPRLVHRLATERVSGAVVISAREDNRETTTGATPKKVVFFDDGRPVYVQSNLVEECLGSVLARAGRISDEQLEDSVRRMRAGEGRQGAVLLSMRAIDAKGLREALSDQLRVKLFDLFAWSKGQFELATEVAAPAETVTLDMSIPEMILRGVIHRVPPVRLLELLSPKLDLYVIPEATQLRKFESLELSPEVRRVLGAVDGTQRVRELLEAGTQPGAIAQLIYALDCTDAITFSPRKRRVTPPLLAEPGIYARPTDMAALRDELSHVCKLLRAERYEEALGIDAVRGADVTERIEQLRARYRPITEPGVAPRDLRPLALEVRARLLGAEEGLAVPLTVRTKGRAAKSASRPIYDASDLVEHTVDEHALTTEPTRAIQPEPTRAVADPAAILTSEPTRALAAKEISAIARALADPDEPTSEDRIGRPTHPDPVFDESTNPGEPRASLLDAARPSVATNEPTRIAPPVAVPPRSRADELRTLDERVERLGQAERFFRRGERALVRERYEDAKNAFERASELCPDEGEFLAHLGYARFHACGVNDADERARALNELSVSRELAPKLDRVYVLAARVHEALGELDKARDMYAHALEANPECHDALTSLDALARSG